jgi:DNA-binding GntR family transcriptional regulator
VTDEEIEQLERVLHYEKEPDTLEEMVQSDTDFHALLYKASRNERLIGILANLREQIQRFRATSLAVPGRPKYAIQEHRAIVDAVARHDVEEAQTLATAHIENAANTMFEVLRYKSKG